MPTTAVLVAEDELVLRTLLADVLRSDGYEVRDVENGRRALDLLRQHRFDVVIADIRMPEVGGRELYEAIQLFQRDLCARFIAMTGWDDLDAEGFLRRVGVPVIRKPFSLDVLRDTVERVVHRAAA
jgi:two-component system, NtrC family, sensor kinase